MPEVLEIDWEKPEAEGIDRAVRILREGGVVAFPTETFYGLAADAANAEAVERIFRIKGRRFNNPVALIIGREAHLKRLVDDIPEAGRLLIRDFWPGPLTLVFKASPAVIPKLTAHTGKIGIRLSSHPVAASLADRLDGPITATSANRSGDPESLSPREVVQSLGDRMDMVIGGGRTPGGRGSTILDVTLRPPLVLREGAIPASWIRERLAIAADVRLPKS